MKRKIVRRKAPRRPEEEGGMIDDFGVNSPEDARALGAMAPEPDKAAKGKTRKESDHV